MQPLLALLDTLPGRPSVQTWADAAEISPRTLQRRFAKVDDAPTPHVVLLLRPERGRAADRRTGIRPDESAERLGYGSSSNLRRAVRRSRELRLGRRGDVAS